jgi:hypothetical protein
VFAHISGKGVGSAETSKSSPSIQSSSMPHHNLAFLLQVALSSDDLKMMMDEVTVEDSDDTPATVNLRTFLLIMEYSSW